MGKFKAEGAWDGVGAGNGVETGHGHWFYVDRKRPSSFFSAPQFL